VIATEAGGMTTAVPHFEQAPRLPASLAGTLILWPLGQGNVIVPVVARGASADEGSADFESAITVRLLNRPPPTADAASRRVYHPPLQQRIT